MTVAALGRVEVGGLRGDDLDVGAGDGVHEALGPEVGHADPGDALDLDDVGRVLVLELLDAGTGPAWRPIP